MGEGGSQRKLPAAPTGATRSGRDSAAFARGEKAAVLPQQRRGGGLWGSAAAGLGVGQRRGPGARAAGRGRA